MQLSDEKIKEFRAILNAESKIKTSKTEAKETAEKLVAYFNWLIKIKNKKYEPKS